MAKRTIKVPKSKPATPALVKCHGEGHTNGNPDGCGICLRYHGAHIACATCVHPDGSALNLPRKPYRRLRNTDPASNGWVIWKASLYKCAKCATVYSDEDLHTPLYNSIVEWEYVSMEANAPIDMFWSAPTTILGLTMRAEANITHVRMGRTCELLPISDAIALLSQA